MNAEKLRHQFVDHEGQKNLEVINDKLLLNEKSDWSICFDQFCDQIKKSVKKDIYTALIDDFSTTMPITKIVSEMNLMNAMKNYFKYQTGAGCGFPKITLKGTVDDWKKFYDKVQILRGLNDKNALELDWWLEYLLPVVDKICETGIDRKVDYQFWGNIYVSLQDYVDSMTGWFNVFFPYTYTDSAGYKKSFVFKTKFENFSFEKGIDQLNAPDGFTKVPFIHKEMMNIEHSMNFYSGILGLKFDEKSNTVSPAYFWSVYQEEVKTK